MFFCRYKNKKRSKFGILATEIRIDETAQTGQLKKIVFKKKRKLNNYSIIR
jgi:hypothetical protein